MIIKPLEILCVPQSNGLKEPSLNLGVVLIFGRLGIEQSGLTMHPAADQQNAALHRLIA
jgi:hypothetical protein